MLFEYISENIYRLDWAERNKWFQVLWGIQYFVAFMSNYDRGMRNNVLFEAFVDFEASFILR